MSGTAVIPVLVVLVILFTALRIIRSNREFKQTIETRIKDSWGAKSSQLFSADMMNDSGAYSDYCETTADGGFWKTHAVIDEITFSDLDLASVYSEIDHTSCQAGREVLLEWLKHPLLKNALHEERMKKIRFFEEDKEKREALLRILIPIGHRKSGSFCRDILTLKEARPIGRARYLTLSVATASGFVLLFFRPLAALAILIPSLFLDFRTHLVMKERTLPYLRGFRTILTLLRASEEIGKQGVPELSEELAAMAEAQEALAPFRRGAFLIMSSGEAGTGLADAVLEYLKMFFHFDLLQFDRMLESYSDHEEEALALLRAVGSIDAAISAASWRVSREIVCIPELEEENVPLRVSGLVHPLLSHPVANALVMDGGVLLTGSNASGKSTFLKACAIGAVLAQSIGTVTAGSYKGSFYRIMTSMALTDNLKGGESYYAVEIRSLLRIFDAISHEGAPVLTMIDEVLRGTNTVERIAASAHLLKAMQEKGACVFAATHDIELTYLLEGIFKNYHFSEEVLDGDVSFDYLIKAGRSNGRNAIRLLKEAGFDRTAAFEAERSAAHFEETGEWKL